MREQSIVKVAVIAAKEDAHYRLSHAREELRAAKDRIDRLEAVVSEAELDVAEIEAWLTANP